MVTYIAIVSHAADFLEKPNGQQEFFHRTVFATFDTDKSGYLENKELDQFLNVFYQAGSIFAGDVRLPSKVKLKKAVMKQLDTNGDGKLDFAELRTLISGGARAGLQFDDLDEDEKGENEGKSRSPSKMKTKKAKSPSKGTPKKAAGNSSMDTKSTKTTKSIDSTQSKDSAKSSGSKQKKKNAKTKKNGTPTKKTKS